LPGFPSLALRLNAVSATLTKTEKLLFTYKFSSLIVKFTYLPHLPLSSNRYGNGDETRFLVQQNDVYTLPSQSYLQIKGKIERMAGSAAQLVDNGIAYLFEQIRYDLNSVEIDKTRNLGAATLLKGLASMTSEEYNSSSNSGFRNLNNANLLNNEGNFSVCVPLKRWLGFFEHYNKIIISMKQELILQ